MAWPNHKPRVSLKLPNVNMRSRCHITIVRQGSPQTQNLDSADPDWCGRESTSPVLNRSNWHPSVNGGTFEAFSRLDSHNVHNEDCVRESTAIVSKAVHGGCLQKLTFANASRHGSRLGSS